MYKIIGADGKEYGPITAEQLKQWIAEGRANAQTKVLVVGSTEWKQLSELPEFNVASTPTPASSPFTQMPANQPVNLDQVNGPAIALMIIAGINLALGAVSLLMNVLGASFLANQQMPDEAWARMLSGTMGVVLNIVGMLVSGIIFYGGWKMKQLESHALAVTASILAIVPCTSPCCLLGIPIGIWALVVLFKPEVKSAFR